MEIGKKIKAVRIAEKLTQIQMAQLVDISVGSLRDWEQGRGIPRSDYFTEIATHEQFKKYAYWLTTDKTIPESGQIAPDFSILLDLGIAESDTEGKKRA